MLLVFWVHLDLIVSWEAIHKRYSLKTTCIVNHDISDGQWEFVFREGRIEIVVVNTDLDFSILFKNGDNVGDPIRVLFLPYKTACDKFMNFSFNSSHIIQVKSSLLLLDWLDVRLNVQTMHSYLWIKSGHIFVILCKDVDILSYECYQFFSLCMW